MEAKDPQDMPSLRGFSNSCRECILLRAPIGLDFIYDVIWNSRHRRTHCSWHCTFLVANENRWPLGDRSHRRDQLSALRGPAPDGSPAQICERDVVGGVGG